jgi:hypothetical protein
MDETRAAQVADAIAWLELTGRVTHVPVTRLTRRLREGDEALIDAMLALLTIPGRPGERLEVLRDFLITQELGEPEELRSSSDWTSSPSPFNVPEWALLPWLGKDIKRLRIRQFYDCLLVGGDGRLPGTTGATVPMRAAGQWRLFGNTHIGEPLMTNLQVAGQFCFDTMFVATAWWLVTLNSWASAEAFFARSHVSFEVGDRPEAVVQALPLFRAHQPIFVPVPHRQNVAVVLNFHGDLPLPSAGPSIPVYVYVEGWAAKDVR